MVVTRLGCQNFRNLRDGELFPCPGVNVIYGGNAQGKTNLLEGLWLFTGGHSFRGAKDTELPRLMAAIRSSSGTEQIEAICDYHYHLTKLSGNDVYAMTFKAFHGPLRGLTSEHYRSAAERKRSVKLHADLTAAIGAGDAEAASRLVGEIIMRADENLSGKKRRR